MNNARDYKVLKDHSGYEKGSVRRCHPKLAEILAESGKISPDPIEVKKGKSGSKEVKKEEKPEPDIISTSSKEDIPPEVREAIEKTEKTEKVNSEKAKAKSEKAK